MMKFFFILGILYHQVDSTDQATKINRSMMKESQSMHYQSGNCQDNSSRKTNGFFLCSQQTRLVAQLVNNERFANL